MRGFYNLEIFLNNLKFFDIYRSRYIFKFLYKTGDEIHLYEVSVTNLLTCFSRVERSHEVCSGAIQYRPDIMPAS